MRARDTVSIYVVVSTIIVNVISSYCYIKYAGNIAFFPEGVGRNHRTNPDTILADSIRPVHVHKSGHISTPFFASRENL